MTKQPSVGFLGTGKMATALAAGWIAKQLISVPKSLGSDPFPGSREAFSEKTGLSITDSNREVCSQCSVIILAVKPHIVKEVLSEGLIHDDHLVVSIAAGITLDQLQTLSNHKGRFIRVMPNTPAMVGQGASGFALGKLATKEDGDLVHQLLNAIGVAYEVNESLLNAVTGLSGSGPAYIYQIIEALSDGGVLAGLPRDVSTRLAAQTVIGAASMVLETGDHPGSLKDMVTSPGGTTITGLHEMEKGGVRASMMNAVLAATQKAQELGNNK